MSKVSLYTDYASDILYDGENLPQYGITSGMKLTEVISKLLSHVDDKIKEHDIDIPAKNVVYNGNTYGIDRGISIEGAKLAGRTLPYEISSTKHKTKFTYNLTDLTLPEGMRLRSSNVKLSGKSGLLFKSDTNYRTIDVDNDKFPIYVDTTLYIITEKGDITLEGSTQITSTSNHTGEVRLYVQDQNYVDGFENNQQDITERIIAKLADLDWAVSFLKPLERNLKHIEANQAEIEAKLDQIESSNKIIVDDDGNIVSPNENFLGLIGRLNALLKKN